MSVETLVGLQSFFSGSPDAMNILILHQNRHKNANSFINEASCVSAQNLRITKWQKTPTKIIILFFDFQQQFVFVFNHWSPSKFLQSPASHAYTVVKDKWKGHSHCPQLRCHSFIPFLLLTATRD